MLKENLLYFIAFQVIIIIFFLQYTMKLELFFDIFFKFEKK